MKLRQAIKIAKQASKRWTPEQRESRPRIRATTLRKAFMRIESEMLYFILKRGLLSR